MSKRQPQRRGAMKREDAREALKQLCSPCGEEVDPDALLALVEDLENPGEDLAWLASYDLDPVVSNMACTTLLDVVVERLLNPRRMKEIVGNALPILTKAFRSPNVSDERKYTLGPLLSWCGGEMEPEAYQACFKDFQGTARRMMLETLRQMPRDYESIEHIVESLDMDADDEAPCGYVAMALGHLGMGLASEMPDMSAMLLSLALLQGISDGVADELSLSFIQGLEAPGTAEGAWCLNELSRWPGLGHLAEPVSRAAAKLRMAGVKPFWPWEAPFQRALVTCPDGDGARQLVLLLDGEEGMDAITPLISDRHGLKHIAATYGNGEDLEMAFTETLGDLVMARCSLDMARMMVSDALRVNAERGTAVSWEAFLYRPMLGQEPLPVDTHTPDLSAYEKNPMDLTPTALKKSLNLAQDMPYELYTFTSDAVYDFVRQCRASGEPASAISERMVQRFLDEVLPLELPVFLSRLGQTLEVASLARLAKRSPHRLAAAIHRALSDGTVRPQDIPYVVRLAEDSLWMVGENLDAGFNSQDEVNQARLDELEAEMDFDNDDDDDIPF